MKKLFKIFLVFIIFTGFVSGVSNLSYVQANSGSGWENFQTEYLGKSVKCAPGETQRDFVLLEYASISQPINPTGTRAKLQVINRDPNGGAALNIAWETSFVVAAVVTPSVCYKPDTQSVRLLVEADASSSYYSYIGAGWWGESRGSRVKEVDQYLRGYAHLQPKAMRPTREILAPNNTFVTNSQPGLVVASNDVSKLYGATQFYRTFMDFWRNGARYQRFASLHGGGVGVRTFTPGTLVDGLYTITSTQQLNGENGIRNLATSFDISCGAGKEKMDVALLEKNQLSLVNPRGISATIQLLNKSTQAVMSTINWPAGTAVSPAFCFTPASQDFAIKLNIDQTAGYLNNSGDIITSNTQVITVAGKSYVRLNYALPKRTTPLTNNVSVAIPSLLIDFGALRKNYDYAWGIVPVGTLTKPVNFIIDTRVPQATINVTGTTTATNALANITLTAMDSGSGLRQVRAVLIPVSAPANVATMTVPFTVGTGLSGGPKELQTIKANVTLLPNTDYRYFIIATDVAGNVFKSPVQTMRTGEVYPDLDANNFRILDTCLPSYVGANLQAICPSTAVEIRMNNVGGRNIPAGTRISYRIESQLPTDSSSAPWQTVTTGNYTAGLLPGAQSTAIPLTLANVQGGSRLRLAVNVAPQLNVSINERNFSNNISSPIILTFTQAPPQLLLVADRALVRVNEIVNLRWEITSPYAVSCELQDGGNVRSINHVSGTTRGNTESSPLINFRIITLSCTSPTGEVTKTSVTVSVVPLVQEV